MHIGHFYGFLLQPFSARFLFFGQMLLGCLEQIELRVLDEVPFLGLLRYLLGESYQVYAYISDYWLEVEALLDEMLHLFVVVYLKWITVTVLTVFLLEIMAGMKIR